MNGLAIVNPLRSKSKPRRKTSSRRKRNPISNLGSYAKKRRSSRSRSTSRALAVSTPSRSTPVRRSRRRRSGSVSRRRRSSGIGRAVNSGVSSLTSSLLPAAVGATAALGVDLAWGYVPIPASLKTGPLAPVTRLAASFAVGWAIGKVAGRKFGRDATIGAMTVTVADLVKGFVKNHTSLPLSYYPARGPARLGYYPSNGPVYDPDVQGYDNSVVYDTAGAYS